MEPARRSASGTCFVLYTRGVTRRFRGISLSGVMNVGWVFVLSFSQRFVVALVRRRVYILTFVLELAV